eukprot:6198023-Pleurochrysis_carterae.AAC.3
MTLTSLKSYVAQSQLHGPHPRAERLGCVFARGYALKHHHEQHDRPARSGPCVAGVRRQTHATGLSNVVSRRA